MEKPLRIQVAMPRRARAAALSLCLVGLLSVHCGDDDEASSGHGRAGGGNAGSSLGGNGSGTSGARPHAGQGGDVSGSSSGGDGDGGTLAGAGYGAAPDNEGGHAGFGSPQGGEGGHGGGGRDGGGTGGAGGSAEGGASGQGGQVSGGEGGIAGEVSGCLPIDILTGSPRDIEGRRAYAIDGDRDLSFQVSLSEPSTLTFEVRIPRDSGAICCDHGTCTAPLFVELHSSVPPTVIADNEWVAAPVWEPRTLTMPTGNYTVRMDGRPDGKLCLDWPKPDVPDQSMPDPFYVSGLCLRAEP